VRFTVIDLIILAAVVFAIGSGYRRGFWLSLAQYAGLVLGVVVGAALVPVVMDGLHVTGPTTRSVGGLLVLVVVGAVGSSVGYAVGEPIRLRLLARPDRARWDSMLGAAFSALAVLSVSWFLGLSLARGPSPELAQALQRSVLLRSLDSVAPRPPGVLGRVEAVLSGVRFPSAFSGFEPLVPSAQPVPPRADTPGIAMAELATLKIVGYGCGGHRVRQRVPRGPGARADQCPRGRRHPGHDNPDTAGPQPQRPGGPIRSQS